MLKLNMLYIFGSNENLKQTNCIKIDANSQKTKQFFIPSKNITCIVILTLILSIWQKDKIFSFFKGKKTDKNSDSQNNIENEKNVELFEMNNKNVYKDSNGEEFKVYKDSNGKEFQTINNVYYTKDKNKEILSSYIEEKEDYYYFLIQESDKNYLIKSDIKHDEENDPRYEEKELSKIQKELLKIQKNINKENKIKCEKWYSTKNGIFYFDENNNIYLVKFSDLDFLLIKMPKLFVLTKKNDKKYAKSISFKYLKYLKD